jgi:chaperone required for assembly of F1-ATPase
LIGAAMSQTSNPIAAAQRLMQRALPRRFYAEVRVAPHRGGFAVALDGRTALTPAGKPLAVADAAVAERLAAEWAGQGETIDPATMPLTRLVNAALDRVAADPDAVRADIVKYAESDLVCYRAEGPDKLTAAQDQHWGPLVAWTEQALGARLAVAAGVVYAEQDRAVADAVAAAVASLATLDLAALHVVTTLTGSAIIALALLKRRLTPEEAWTAALVDEDWQMSQWGTDASAIAVRANRRRDFDAAAFVLAAA